MVGIRSGISSNDLPQLESEERLMRARQASVAKTSDLSDTTGSSWRSMLLTELRASNP